MLKTTWRRPLKPEEARVDFKRLEEQWTLLETKYIDAMSAVFSQVIERLSLDLRRILDGRSYEELSTLRLGFKDKLVATAREHYIEAYRFGKGEVHSEFETKKGLTVSANTAQYFALKAEAVVTDMLEQIRSDVNFTVLAGVRAGKSTEEILEEVKGPAEAELAQVAA